MTTVILSEMKTAVSLPDSLFRRADALARQLGIPRSQLYARAIDDYLRSHSQEHVTTALNELYATQDSTLDTAIARQQSTAIPNEDW